MGSARLVGWSMALLATTAAAAPGDLLVVTGNVVNVRTGPGTDNPVLFRAHRAQQVQEMTRSGDWVQVQIPDQAADGWIHQSLLQLVARAEPAPGPRREPPESPAGEPRFAVAPPSNPAGGALLPAGESQALALFRGNVDELNARAVAVAGVELFTGAEPGGDGTVRVMVTEMWGMVPAPGQQSYVNALFDHWYLASGGSGPLRVQVVDPTGAVVGEKSGPAR
jgi:Bacterial SH3 domain